ncbi:MAG: diguanylate cyclase [Gammaproteobacteria bacterium]|nr:MAG: diguanylate cyclase [Gammaproteobacteria bacterium]
MRAGGHTTVIQRILERRAAEATPEETTATIAVMLRVMPPPRALLVCQDAPLLEQLARRIPPDMLDYESLADEDDALRRFESEFRPVVVTDSLELVRRLRARATVRTPFILYVAPLDDTAGREAGFAAGADECVGRRTSSRELDARLAAARRIAELESVLRVTLAENRKLSATDDLTRVNSRRFFSKHFPREVERAARYGRALSLVLCDIDLFAVVLPETGYQQALDVARKLRAVVAQPPYTNEGKTMEVTASFGLCGLDRVPGGERRLAERVLKIADAALYRSKNAGRNRVTATMLNATGE